MADLSITLRSEKGEPLTIEEMDNNFRILANAVENMEFSGGVTVTGDVVGTGPNTNLVLQLRTLDGYTSGQVSNYTSVNVDSKGRVISGSKPTTLFGYGITDAQPKSDALTSISDISSESGLLKKTGSTWSLDNSSYLTANQTITCSGDATGSGNANITLTLSNSGVTSGTYKSVTVDAKGRVTAGTNPTTLIGYGITDAQPLDADLTAIAGLAGTSGLLKKTAENSWELDSNSYLTANQTINYTGDVAGSGSTSVSLTLSNVATPGTYTSVTVDAKGRVITGTNPTTLIEYGITDAQPLDADLTSIAGLTGTSGLLKKTAENTWELDSNSYLTANQTITCSGDATGSGNANITLTLSNVATPGTYTSVTVDAKGRVTAGTNPTTLVGYGITDAQPLDGDLTAIAGLGGTSGLLKKTAENTWVLDTTSYVSSTQNLTFVGDVSGVGSSSSSISLTLANSGVTAGTYNNVATQVRPFTVDAKGRVTAIGTAITISPEWNNISGKPTTLSGYGITDAVPSSQKGQINGIATLGSDGKIPTDQLPSSVDDIIEVASYTNLPASGNAATIYLALDTNKIYRWSGSTYIEVGATSGNADSATKLYTARTISATGDASWTVTFDGTTNVSSALTLANSGVTAGTYKSVTVDAKGRVTSGTNPTTLVGYGITDAQPLDADLTSIAGLAGTSGLLKKTAANTWILDTSSYLTSNQSITYSGDVSGSGTNSVTLTLANSGVTAGTYKSLTVDAKGRVTAGTNPTTLVGYGITDAQPLDADLTAIAGLAGTTGLLKKTAANTWTLDTTAYLTSNQSITYSGDVSGSGTNSVTLTLANSGVTTGTYRSVTVDAKGRVTAGTNPTTLAEYGITNAQPLDADLTAIAALTGTSGLLKKTAANTWTLDTTAYLTSNQSITYSGDVTGSGTNSVTLTLANSGVTAGTYNNVATQARPFTVDTKGRIVAIGTPVDITPAWSNVTGKPTTLAGYGITNAQPLDADLTAIAALTGTSGILKKTAADTWTLDTATYLTSALTLSFSGDVTGSGSTSGSTPIIINLVGSGVTAGTYKSVTVDAKGRVTAGTNPTTLVGYGITDAQPLSGDLTQIAALIGTGSLAKTSTGWSLQTGSYLTQNQNISFYGDATGSGSTSVTLTLANSGVTTGTYKSVTVDAKGRVTSGTNPTTLSGYGIADAQPLDADLTAIAGLTGTSGILKKTAANTWTLDTATYLTSNQSTTFTGDVTGSGSGSVALTLSNSGVTAGTYNNNGGQVRPFTVDTKGRITGIGTAIDITPAWSSVTGKPTTLSGYGITNAQQLDADLTAIAGLSDSATGYLKKTAANTWTLDSAVGSAPTITYSGDVTGSGTTAVTLTLGNTGVTAGTYNNIAGQLRPFTIDSKGRVTSVGAAINIAPAWSSVTGKPTTLSGYGIADAQPLDADLTAIAALTGTNGYLKKTANNTWAIDPSVGNGAFVSGISSYTNNSTPTNTQNFSLVSGDVGKIVILRNPNVIFEPVSCSVNLPTISTLTASQDRLPIIITNNSASGDITFFLRPASGDNILSRVNVFFTSGFISLGTRSIVELIPNKADNTWYIASQFEAGILNRAQATGLNGIFEYTSTGTVKKKRGVLDLTCVKSAVGTYKLTPVEPSIDQNATAVACTTSASTFATVSLVDPTSGTPYVMVYTRNLSGTLVDSGFVVYYCYSSSKTSTYP